MLLLIVAVWVLILLSLWLYKAAQYRAKKDSSKFTIGLFHPYCNAGGGGERVLFMALAAILSDNNNDDNLRILIYTGDTREVSKTVLFEKAKNRFGVQIDLDERVEIVYLERRRFVEAKMYPVFTLLGQSIGSMWLGLEALNKSPSTPDVLIDTMGYAFVMPLFKYLAKCKVACYTHYPTISTDMLRAVDSRRSGYNNRGFVAKSAILSGLKLLYYKMFASLYGLMGRCSDLTMVNSSWTEMHITGIWGKQNVYKLYPPCDVSLFRSVQKVNDEEIRIVSLGQFRPEKDHPLQIRILAAIRDELMKNDNEALWKRIKLVLIGGCRDASDQSRVSDLRDLSRHLSVESNVEFHINADLALLKQELGRGLIGLHTMWNEHFGIAVVELMASGLIVVAHRSGGPLMDIVEDEQNGFLADSEESYAQSILHIIQELDEEEKERVVMRAKSSLEKFSDETFNREWLRLTKDLLSNETSK